MFLTPDLPVEEVALTVLVTGGTCMPNGCDTTVSVWLLGWLVAGRGKGGGKQTEAIEQLMVRLLGPSNISRPISKKNCCRGIQLAAVKGKKSEKEPKHLAWA
jgi:hypothetical protein